jgi:hypothetical protein
MFSVFNEHRTTVKYFFALLRFLLQHTRAAQTMLKSISIAGNKKKFNNPSMNKILFLLKNCILLNNILEDRGQDILLVHFHHIILSRLLLA